MKQKVETNEDALVQQRKQLLDSLEKSIQVLQAKEKELKGSIASLKAALNEAFDKKENEIAEKQAGLSKDEAELKRARKIQEEELHKLKNEIDKFNEHKKSHELSMQAEIASLASRADNINEKERALASEAEELKNLRREAQSSNEKIIEMFNENKKELAVIAAKKEELQRDYLKIDSVVKSNDLREQFIQERLSLAAEKEKENISYANALRRKEEQLVKESNELDKKSDELALTVKKNTEQRGDIAELKEKNKAEEVRLKNLAVDLLNREAKLADKEKLFAKKMEER